MSQGKISKAAMSLLRLGQAIVHYHRARCPDPFSGGKPDTPAETLRERADALTTDVQLNIAQERSLAPVCKALGLGLCEVPTVEVTQAVCLVLYCDMVTFDDHETVESTAARLAGLWDDDQLRGRLNAFDLVAQLLEKRVFQLSERRIEVSPTLRRLVSRHALAVPGLTDKQVGQYLASRHSRGRKLKPANRKSPQLRNRIRKIPFLTPAEILSEFARFGYVSQEGAVKALSLAAHRHIARLRHIYVDGIPERELPRRENLLLYGPTGTGKSFAVKTLFNDILQIPTALMDATALSETGYVGQDCHDILVRLYMEAERDVSLAECGIACVDEFDKLAASGVNRNVFGGGGTRNDVSRSGVQRSLLRILEDDAEVMVPTEMGPFRRGSMVKFRTSNVLFIGSGAFTGLDVGQCDRPRIGFAESDGACFQSDVVSALSTYGLMRELVGRFGALIRFDDLTAGDLATILERNAVQRYRRELKLAGISLRVDSDVKEVIVRRAFDRGTGARGLSLALLDALHEACFDAYSEPNARSLRLYVENDSIRWQIRKRRRQTKGEIAA